MSGTVTADPARSATLEELIERRTLANRTLFAAESERVARLCHRMAERFARGGRLLALGADAAARSDARHVAVEFVHPVIVGKRALPALALTGSPSELASGLALLAQDADIVIAFGGEEDASVSEALALARARGCLTVAFADLGAEWEFLAPSEDAFVRQELVETLYHVLWELVHVFFEHRGLLEGRDRRPVHDPGASSFLYPFLGEREDELEPVIEDVRRSALVKAAEVGALREETLRANRGSLQAAACELRERFERGGKLMALGNGGSATDAIDLVADFRVACGAGPPRPAIDLTEDPSILTAIANDVGVEAIFARQVIAYASGQDVLVALSTSGGSANVIAALRRAREQRLLTIAFVGYDGGRIAAEELADHVIVTRSEHIPRIQEAQASAYHALRELVEHVEPAGRR
ncbi:MAG TPA: SIS domain-containing protein [Solirubrobacteraceae bacterium]|jgi:D-sedoheptulose 7-phosphate isomerase|nr:SIS domain-containing protein [Solirubrobacteraceae bacterium]